jgi:hypothetical protein
MLYHYKDQSINLLRKMIVVYFVNHMKLICPAGNTHSYCGYIQRTPVTVVTLVTYFI